MAFTPRLTDIGILGNLHWYSNDNPYYATGYGMPNCTAYALSMGTFLGNC